MLASSFDGLWLIGYSESSVLLAINLLQNSSLAIVASKEQLVPVANLIQSTQGKCWQSQTIAVGIYVVQCFCPFLSIVVRLFS